MSRMLLLVCLACSLQAFSQQNYASISFGVSLPQGEYAMTGNLADYGYATTGGAIKFDAAYFPVSYLGIGGAFSVGSNYAMRDSILQDMIRHIEENASSIPDIPNDAEILYGTGFWNYINLFLGPHLSARISQRLYLDLRALAGISVLRPPDQELTITFDGNEIYSNISRNKLAFGLTAGGGMRYRLNSIIALKLGVDYYQARSRFKYDFDLFSGVADEVPPVDSRFMIRTVELSAGLAYSF